MNLKQFVGPLAIFLTTLASLPASANPVTYKGNNVFTTGGGVVYFSAQSGEVTLANVWLTLKKKVDACGVATITDVLPNKEIYFGEDEDQVTGQVKDITDVGWKCVVTNGIAELKAKKAGETLTPGSFPAAGTLLRQQNKLFLYLPTQAGRTVPIIYNGSVTKQLKPNACGFSIVKFGSAVADSQTQLVITGSTPTAFANLPFAGEAPLCKEWSVLPNELAVLTDF